MSSAQWQSLRSVIYGLTFALCLHIQADRQNFRDHCKSVAGQWQQSIWRDCPGQSGTSGGYDVLKTTNSETTLQILHTSLLLSIHPSSPSFLLHLVIPPPSGFLLSTSFSVPSLRSQSHISLFSIPLSLLLPIPSLPR